MATVRRPPGFGEPHLAFESAPVVVWFTDPIGMLIQITSPIHGSADIARFISVTAYERLLELRGASRQRITVVHDYTAITGYDSESRRVLTDWGLRIKNEVERIVVIQPPAKNKMLRMGLGAAASALSMIGLKIDFEDSLILTVGRLGLRPHPAAARSA